MGVKQDCSSRIGGVTTTGKPASSTRRPKPTTGKPTSSTRRPKPSTAKPLSTTRRPRPSTQKPNPSSTTRKIDLPKLPFESEKYQCAQFLKPDLKKFPKAGTDLKQTGDACLANPKCIGVSDNGKCNGVRNKWKDKKTGKTLTEIHRLCGAYKKVTNPGQCTHCVKQDCSSRIGGVTTTGKPTSSTRRPKPSTAKPLSTTRRPRPSTQKPNPSSTTRKIDLPKLPFESEKYQCAQFLKPDLKKFPKAGTDLKQTGDYEPKLTLSLVGQSRDELTETALPK